jgi:hypothetical protein
MNDDLCCHPRVKLWSIFYRVQGSGLNRAISPYVNINTTYRSTQGIEKGVQERSSSFYPFEEVKDLCKFGPGQ